MPKIDKKFNNTGTNPAFQNVCRSDKISEKIISSNEFIKQHRQNPTDIFY